MVSIFYSVDRRRYFLQIQICQYRSDSLLCNISSVIFTYDDTFYGKYCLNLKQYILSDLPNTFVNQSVLKYIQNRYMYLCTLKSPHLQPSFCLSFYVQYKIVLVSNPIWSRCRHPWSWRLDDDNMKIFKAGHKYNILPGAGAGRHQHRAAIWRWSTLGCCPTI